MLNLREFYSTITKPADTSRGIVVLLPDRTVVFNEFKNIVIELNTVFLEGEVECLTFFIQDIKAIITEADSQLLKGQAKPEIIIPIEKLFHLNLDGIYPLVDRYNWFKSYNINVHTEPFDEDIREAILAAKSSGGVYNYIIDANNTSYFMIIYKGLVTMAKADTVTVEVMINPNEPQFFVTKFTTFKKKEKLQITSYIPFLNIPKTQG